MLLALHHCSATQSCLCSVGVVDVCLLTLGYLLSCSSFFFQNKNKRSKALRESTSISQSDKDKYLACMHIPYTSVEESLSEPELGRHDGNSSGSDEDLPNRKRLCVRPLLWRSTEVNGLMARLERKVT